MKRFIVQALVDERVVWDVMKYLEGARATDIMARPAGDAAPKPNGAGLGAGNYPRPTSMQAQARAAIHLALASAPQVTKKQVCESLPDIKRGAIDAQFNKLTADGILKRVGFATYAKGRKKAP